MRANGGLTISRTLLRATGLSLFLLIPLGAALLTGFNRADGCLDAGGCLDSRTGECVFDQSEESRCAGAPSWLPRGTSWLVPATAVVLPVSVALLVVRDRRASRRRETPSP